MNSGQSRKFAEHDRVPSPPDFACFGAQYAGQRPTGKSLFLGSMLGRIANGCRYRRHGRNSLFASDELPGRNGGIRLGYCLGDSGSPSGA